MSATAVTSTRLPINKIAVGTLLAGVLAAVLNNVYGLLFTAFTGNSLELIGPVSITLASLIPMLVAGVGFFVLARFAGSRANLIYLIGTLGFTLLSLAGPLANQLPDGSVPPAFFPALTIPMHLIAGGVAAFILPRLASR